MKFLKSFVVFSALTGLMAAGSVYAAVGGGATIHNAASLTFSGGQVTAQVNVMVRTIGTPPTFIAGDIDANSGDAVTVNYQIISNSNGADTYDLDVDSNDSNVSAPSSLSILPLSIDLGGSITSRPSTVGSIYIAAGSQTHLSGGDVVRMNLGGTDYFYTLAAVIPGTPAFTVGNTTTPEVATQLQLTPLNAAPAILNGNIPVGTQVGEVGEFVVALTAGDPTTPGVDGEHELEISGTTGEPGPGGPGDVISFTDPVPVVVTVLSGDATLVKEARNITVDPGSAFATTGVTARSGDVIEYRLTAGTVANLDVTVATLTDSIPEHATYVADSTTLNAVPVADVAGTSALVGGMPINSPGGAAGEILDGETAVIIFQVTVN